LLASTCQAYFDLDVHREHLEYEARQSTTVRRWAARAATLLRSLRRAASQTDLY
jgi:hypothetical protein